MSLLVLLFHFLLFTLSPTERASVAALSRWSREDPRANAERGQAGLRAKFLREIDAEPPGSPRPSVSAAPTSATAST